LLPFQDYLDEMLPYQHYLDEIHSWAGTPALEASLANPVEFIIPFVRLVLGRIAQSIDKGWAGAWYALNPGLGELWDETLSTEEELHYSALMQVKCLARALPHLRRFCDIHKTGPSPMLDDALMDLQAVIEDAARLRDAMEDRLGRRAAMLALKESQKSIKIADSLQTLTQLAFVFVPLNFGVSIFGANISEFGSGVVPAWALAVTASCVCLATLGVSWLWTTTRRRTKDHAADGRANKWLRYVARPILLFSLRSPGLAFILALYALTHWGERQSMSKTMHRLAVRDLVSVDGESPRRTCDLSNFPRAPEGTAFRRAFWQNCLHSVGRYTSQDDWQDDRFWKHRVRRRREANGGVSSLP